MKNINMKKAMEMFNIEVEAVEPQEVLSREDLEMTKKILDTLDAIDNNLRAAIEAAKEMESIEVEVLLDSVSFESKPQGATIAGIVNRLPQNKIRINLEDLANAAINGQSWKASVLSGTNNASFVSSSLVALDIDNKESYTSVDEFMAMNHKYQPCFIYETFSSTEEHNRFRAVYAFDDVTYDFNTMVALYNEVKAQYPTVDIDESVDPGKILFGGKALRYFNNVANSLPELAVGVLEASKVSTPAQTSNAITGTVEVGDFIDAELEILENLRAVAYKYENVKSLDLNESDEWITKNVSIEDALAIPQNVRFRCILPDHEDNHPSARIATIGDEQVYFCTCEASGYRILPLLCKLFKKNIYTVKRLVLESLGIEYGTEYQRNAEKQIVDMQRHLIKRLTPDLKDYLSRRKLFQPYYHVTAFALSHIPYNSFANDDRIVFFLSQRAFQKHMKDHDVRGKADAKLTALCELGLLKKLTDSELKDYVLRKANQTKNELKEKLSHNTGIKLTDINRVDFYELVDLSPAVVKRALSIIDSMKTNAVRQRGNSIDRRINAFGAEEVTNNIHVQSTVNTAKLNKTQSKLEAVIVDLLGSNKYFSEAELATAYRNTDKRHISKVAAQQTVLDYVPYFINAGLIKRVRVNKDTRKQYDITTKYQSNSFVYVAK